MLPDFPILAAFAALAVLGIGLFIKDLAEILRNGRRAFGNRKDCD
jgi:hypothetical protein